MSAINEKDIDLIETKVSSEDIYDGVLLHVKKDTVKLPNGDLAPREWIKHPGAASVIPLTDDGKVILVRQYRYPIGQVTVEVPAGKLDKEGENPMECAVRELSEETGYTAKEYRHLATLATTVGFSNELIYLYAAKGLKAGEQHTDEDEFINLQIVTLEEAVEMVNHGEILDGKSIISILMLRDLVNKGEF